MGSAEGDNCAGAVIGLAPVIAWPIAAAAVGAPILLARMGRTRREPFSRKRGSVHYRSGRNSAGKELVPSPTEAEEPGGRTAPGSDLPASLSTADRRLTSELSISTASAIPLKEHSAPEFASSNLAPSRPLPWPRTNGATLPVGSRRGRSGVGNRSTVRARGSTRQAGESSVSRRLSIRLPEP